MKKAKVERPSDLPLTISAVPLVHDLVRKNNAETRPRKRQRCAELLNSAFEKLGAEASSSVASHDERAQRVQDLNTLLSEFVERYQSLPRNTSLAAVLHTLGNGGLTEEGASLVRRIVASRTALPDAFASSFNERVATVALRVLVKASTVDYPLLHQVLELLPPDAFKRRLFTPLFSHACEVGNVSFGLEMLRLALQREIELWDEDYHYILQNIASAGKSGAVSADAVAATVEEVVTAMEAHHPVVGSANAALLKELLRGESCKVDEDGTCSRCGCRLKSFELTEEDRHVLVDDLVEKLIKPRVEGMSHYEPDKATTPEEQIKRWADFEQFKRTIAEADYDTVIDGANIGYYGLSSWYRSAKEEKLRSGGVDPASVPLHERTEVPFPVDVPPKFQLIEDMRKSVQQRGKRPIIVLHHRHISNPSPTNAAVMEAWTAARALVPSPAFLNDDYCWLYAALSQPSVFVVSNDQMRDHHFTMLSPRCFLRWRQRHRITYRALFQQATQAVTLVTRLPRPYAVWVQRAVAASLSMEAASLAGTSHHWHIPYMDSIEVLDQATNRTTTADSDVELSKDGDDDCSAWLCTFQTSSDATR